jgi:hypothetical protein
VRDVVGKRENKRERESVAQQKSRTTMFEGLKRMPSAAFSAITEMRFTMEPALISPR